MVDKYQKTILRRCNELAMRSRGHTATNPNVGAIVTNRSQNKILGEGWHQFFGGPHAEVNAIEKATKNNLPAKMTIAVSLEPCNHSGKTPACTKTIIDHQFSEVLVDQIDPDPRMQSQSLEMLRKAGIAVPNPLSSQEGDEVIHPFSINVLQKRPFIRLKMAISNDHFIGQKNKKIKISNAISDRWVHRLRNETQAIMAGTNTIMNDDPMLTSRYGNEYQPIPILLDRRGILSTQLKVYKRSGEKITITSSKRSDYPGTILRLNPHDLNDTFYALHQQNIGSILIEGGSTFFTSLFRKNLWDELILIENTALRLGSGISAPIFQVPEPVKEIKFGTDTIKFVNNPHCR